MTKKVMPADLIKIPEWKQLVEYAKDWEYGSTHTHQECANIMGLEYPSNRYRSMIQHVKTVLLMDHQKLLRASPGEGYRVVLPSHMVDEMMGEYRHGVRRVEKATVIGIQTPISLLSTEEIRVSRTLTDHYSRTLVLMKGKQAEGAEMMKLLERSPRIQLSS